MAFKKKKRAAVISPSDSGYLLAAAVCLLRLRGIYYRGSLIYMRHGLLATDHFANSQADAATASIFFAWTVAGSETLTSDTRVHPCGISLSLPRFVVLQIFCPRLSSQPPPGSHLILPRILCV